MIKTNQMVRFWLNYAEIKNGTLIAFDLAFISLIHTITKDSHSILVPFMYIFSFLSLGVIIKSFCPQIHKESTNNHKNLLFYKDISYYKNNENQFYKDFQKYKSKNQSKEFDNSTYSELFYQDLSYEITQNAVITVSKNKSFKTALIFTIIAFMVTGIFLLFENLSLIFPKFIFFLLFL